jgi:hypothetical protein
MTMHDENDDDDDNKYDDGYDIDEAGDYDNDDGNDDGDFDVSDADIRTGRKSMVRALSLWQRICFFLNHRKPRE